MIEYRKTAVTYQGDGNTSVFPFSFAVTDANSVRVSIYDKATDVSVELTRDYFVDMTANVVHYPGYAPGESVDAHAQPPKLPRGKNITIYRVTPIDQLTDLGNKYPLPYIETMADKLTAILQEHDERLGRAVTSQKGSDITPKELIDSIFRTGEKVDAAMNAANGSAAHAAASQTAAKSSEDAAREMTEQMHAVFSNSVTEIKNALSTNYVPQEQANEMRKDIANAGIAILQRSHAYQVGDIAYHKALPSWARLECVRAGTTGATLPTKIEQMVQNGGVMLTDGTVVWIIDDLRDGTPVGAVRGSLYLPAGYVKANGATVQRADYPRLVALADRHNLWTDDVTANAGLFGRGDGAATFVLPNWTDRMVQLANDSAGLSIEAGLPNITGEFSAAFCGGWIGRYDSPKGSLTKVNDYSPRLGESNNAPSSYGTHYLFDASKSNHIYGASSTVQPAAIKLIPIIRY